MITKMRQLEMAFSMASTDGVFDDDYFCVIFSHSVSWLGS